MDRLWTIGHSTRTLGEFVGMLREAGIACVADVRRFPGSRRHPQFGAEALAAGLAGAGIGYVHMPGLGGRRRPRPDSPHTAWRNAGFRGYADYMDTPAYAAARDTIARNDPHTRGIVILGLEAGVEALQESFRQAARFDLVKGFAVGRSIFGPAALK